MATVNPFGLLGEDDTDDLTQLIAKTAALAPTSAPPSQQQPKPQAKLPSKPLPPAQAVKEQRNEGRGGGRGGSREGGGRGYGGGDREGGGRGFGGGDRGGYRGRGDRGSGGGGGGYNRDRVNNENSFSSNGAPPEEGDADKGGRRGGYGAPRGAYRVGGSGGGRRGGFNNGEVDGEQRPRQRVFERHSATGRGNEFKREGAGRGNWGSVTDDITQDSEELGNTDSAEKSFTAEKQPGDEVAADASKENPVAETEEKEPEEKEMTLEEYEKVKEEKRKALLQGLKVEERKVTVDKEFETMQQLSGKKTNNDIYAKLGSDKDKKKEIADKEERAKKSVSINDFLKPAEGEKFYSPGGRGGRGRGRGPRGGGAGGFSGGHTAAVSAPSIEDPGQFPQLK